MKWKMLGGISSLITVLCLVLIGTILVSDGGDVQQYKKNVSKGNRVKSNIDWAKLQKRNPNIYAWVEVPGTQIDYPVLQSASNQEEDFYLRHNIDDRYEFAGSIYSQKENSKDFRDPVSVLYGHNMINGSMFGTLKNFENPDFFERHPIFYIYTPGQILTYKILSFQIGSDRHILESFHPDQTEGFQKFIKSITEKDMVRDGVVIASTDQIVTLSTCSPAEKKRRLLHGVLVKTEKRK